MHILPEIRLTARALVLKNGKILVQKKVTDTGEVTYTLPGGAVEAHELMSDAVRRECAEELGTEVTVHGLLFVGEVFKPRPNPPNSHRHQIEHIFSCSVPEHYIPQNGPHPDKHQQEIIWLDASALDTVGFSPEGLRTPLLQVIGGAETPPARCYLGQILP